MIGGALGRLSGWIHSLVGSEKLDELPDAEVGRARRSFVEWLLKAEQLPTDDRVVDKSSQSLFSLLFSSEALPHDETPNPRAGGSSFLARLLSPERLPVDPVAGKGPGCRDSSRGRAA
jgi:hypothetical protein